MIFLQLCQKNKRNNNSGTAPLGQQPDAQLNDEASAHDDEDAEDQEDGEDEPVDEEEDAIDQTNKWQHFLQGITNLNEPLLDSLFSQAKLIGSCEQEIIEVSFPKDLSFFQEWLESMTKAWLPVLQTSLPQVKQLKPLFDGEVKSARVAQPASRQPIIPVAQKPRVAMQPQAQSYPQRAGGMQFTPKTKKVSLVVGLPIDVSDVEIWKKTNLILHHFPGTVTQMKENV